MLGTDLKMALASLRANKWRSFLTMLGVIIGVVSVVTTVSIGEGVKRQVSGQINELGPDLITVLPGRLVNRNSDGSILDVNIFNFFGSSGELSERDWETIQETEGVKVAVPMSLAPGIPRFEDRAYERGTVIAVTDGAKEILSTKIEYGEFFSEDDLNPRTAVIGRHVAEELFQESVPIGKAFELRGQQFVVRGILEEFITSPFSLGTNFNSAVLIPYEIGKAIGDNQTQIYQILVKPQENRPVPRVTEAVRHNLERSRGEQLDFTILRYEENLALATTVLNLLTAMITGIAAISLVVGGIGIMNIMLVSVTERTHEIGVRKAIGATNGQVYNQFVTEATVLSVIGGVAGIAASVLANYLLRIFTDLQPVITLPIVIIATGVAMVVGIIFGVTPALKAAHKSPIEALRHE